jgi:DNA-binding LacI/PurR family transcriptional regulator
VPLVFLDRHVPGVRATTFTTDNAGGAATLVRRCRQAGAQWLVSLFDEDNAVERARRVGALRAARDMGMKLVAAEDLCRLPRSSKLAIVATVSRRIHDFARARYQDLTWHELVFACFDEWEGTPYPAKRAFVCEQDFGRMAERASEHLLGLIGGQREMARVHTIEPKAVRQIEGWDECSP